MNSFTLEPFVGPLPLRFGMTVGEVEQQIGKPNTSAANYFGNRSEARPLLNLGYSADTERLAEAVFLPGAQLFFEGRNLFEETDAIRFLRQFDGSPFLWVGFVIFLKLGIRLSGFHDNDEAQKAIGVVERGHWDEYIDDFVPFE